MKKLLLISTIAFTILVLIGCSESSTDSNTKRADYKDLNQKELKELKAEIDSYKWTDKQKKANKRADWKDEPIK